MNVSRFAVAIMILSGSVMLPACGAADTKIITQNDVTYTKVNGVELKLDVARPAEGDGPFPVVFVIHGGGWREGNKNDMRPAIAEFARRGYVGVSPQYRFCPQDRFPAQVHDVKAAVRWVKGHAKEFKADPARVGAMGFSAGGHLAMMLGVTEASDGLEGDVAESGINSKIQAVVNYFGPTDLSADDYPEVTRPILKEFLGGTPKDKADAAAKASPLTFVSKGDAPILTFQGTKDPLVPHSQAVKLAEAMTKAEVPGRVELLVGEGHGWSGDELKRTLDATFSFFDGYLKPRPK